jgi:predicted SnoaL-like aldol condensation-catalyzing enzyme
MSLSCTSLSCVSEPSQLEKNKALVVKFYEMAFVDRRGVEAAELYLSEDYIQHNPYTATGRQAFIDYVLSSSKEKPNANSDIKRVIAEGDLVVVHVHDTLNKLDRGSAVVDIFRVENDKIVEHWDVIQAIPEKDYSGNTMF